MRIKPIVSQFVFFLILSLGLIGIDYYFHGKNRVKQYLTTLTYPIYQVVNSPHQFGSWLSGWFADRKELAQSVQDLQLENTLLKIKLQQHESRLSQEQQFQAQVDSADKFSRKILSANILKVNLSNHRQQLVVDKGSQNAVYLGQPVVDQFGIIGQVTKLSLYHSVVTLITHASQSTPVLIRRNNLRALLYGTGETDQLEIKFLGEQADIRSGDVLLTSGIGNRYPSGYPIAKVTAVEHDANESFLSVAAEPLAKLYHGEQVLLIWPAGSGSEVDSTDTLSQALSMHQGFNVLR